MTQKKKRSFEQDCSRLEEIVESLEDDQLPLEESIKLFTEGVDLALKARGQLEQSEMKVKKLIAGMQGGFELEDLDKEQ